MERREFSGGTESTRAEGLADNHASCAVVVPCYNEADRLDLAAFTGYLSSTQSVDLLFVNDGSTDDTVQLLEVLQARFPGRASILDLKVNAGKAEAVRSGLLHLLSGPPRSIVGFWDADLATPLSAILEMERVFEVRPQSAMVFGARVRLLGREIDRSPVRHYLGRIFATMVSLLLKVPIYDTQCGAKLFRNTQELKFVLSRPFQSRWIFDVELLARFLKLHVDDRSYASTAIYEHPLVRWQDVAGSRLRTFDFVKAIAELMHIWRVEVR